MDRQAHPRSTTRALAAACLVSALLAPGAAASPPKEQPGEPKRQATKPTRSSLAGTRWRLVEIQSMDDQAGVSRPSDRSLYTMDLDADGTASFRLN